MGGVTLSRGQAWRLIGPTAKPRPCSPAAGPPSGIVSARFSGPADWYLPSAMAAGSRYLITVRIFFTWKLKRAYIVRLNFASCPRFDNLNRWLSGPPTATAPLYCVAAGRFLNISFASTSGWCLLQSSPHIGTAFVHPLWECRDCSVRLRLGN